MVQNHFCLSGVFFKWPSVQILFLFFTSAITEFWERFLNGQASLISMTLKPNLNPKTCPKLPNPGKLSSCTLTILNFTVKFKIGLDLLLGLGSELECYLGLGSLYQHSGGVWVEIFPLKLVLTLKPNPDP